MRLPENDFTVQKAANKLESQKARPILDPGYINRSLPSSGSVSSVANLSRPSIHRFPRSDGLVDKGSPPEEGHSLNLGTRGAS